MHVNLKGDLDALRKAEQSTRRWAKIWIVVTVGVAIVEAIWALNALLNADWATFMFAGALATVLALWAPKSYRNDMLQAKLFGQMAEAVQLEIWYEQELQELRRSDSFGEGPDGE